MTKEELANKLEAYGITDLAEEVRNSEVSIDDSAHFTIFDREVEEERGEEATEPVIRLLRKNGTE